MRCPDCRKRYKLKPLLHKKVVQATIVCTCGSQLELVKRSWLSKGWMLPKVRKR